MASTHPHRYVAISPYPAERAQILSTHLSGSVGTLGDHLGKRRLDPGLLQKEVAELRCVSKSVISETLKSALYRQITDAESALEVLLNHFAKLKESDQGRENP